MSEDSELKTSPGESQFREMLEGHVVQALTNHPLIDPEAKSLLEGTGDEAKVRHAIDTTRIWLQLTLGEMARENSGTEGLPDFISKVSKGVEKTMISEDAQPLKTIAQMQEEVEKLKKEHGPDSKSPDPSVMLGASLATDLTSKALDELEDQPEDIEKSA